LTSSHSSQFASFTAAQQSRIRQNSLRTSGYTRVRLSAWTNHHFLASNPMGARRCLACGRSFQPRPQVPQQNYCSAKDCQRERKKLWERDRRRNDPDYRRNQASASQAWSRKHPDYWRDYRRANPQYTERNRSTQQTRRAESHSPLPVAKMDVSGAATALASGLYRLTKLHGGAVAKMDAWLVRITVLSTA